MAILLSGRRRARGIWTRGHSLSASRRGGERALGCLFYRGVAVALGPFVFYFLWLSLTLCFLGIHGRVSIVLCSHFSIDARQGKRIRRRFFWWTFTAPITVSRTNDTTGFVHFENEMGVAKTFTDGIQEHGLAVREPNRDIYHAIRIGNLT